MRKWIWAGAVLPLVALGTTPAQADPRPSQPAHSGWMFRGAIGAGYDSTRGEFTPFDFAGPAMSSQLALGGYVVPNFALHATLWNGLAFNPSGTRADGSSVPRSQFTMSSTGIGVGATYVVAANDVFASVSFGISTLNLEATTATFAIYANAATGFAVNATVGKLFALSPEWSVGAAGQFFFHTNSEEGASYTESFTSLGGGVVGMLAYH